MTVEVSVIGPITVRTPAGIETIAGDKMQSLVAILALAAPQSVSDGRLIDEIWRHGEVPANPVNALQAQVSQLRRILGRDRVTREPHGYSLHLEPLQVDAQRLEHLVRLGREHALSGQHGAAATHYAEAVALVRGPPLAGLLDRSFAREAAARLDGLVAEAHEGMVDAALATGRHAEVVETLRSLVVQHPLRERFHAQLVTALYRCGRQVEALQAYQDVRRTLADELGLDPGPELRTLEHAVLSHDSSLRAAMPVVSAARPPPLPRALTSFVGRGPELAALRRAMDSARLVTAVGPAGVGKTRLVLEAAAAAADRSEVWYVELAPVTEAIAVPEAVASGVGARDRSSAEGTDALSGPDQRTVDFFGQRDAVLILDNCEHVVEATARCARALLIGCPGLTIVATSREPLGVDGEVQLGVNPLDEIDAVRLFTDRARAVQPLFARPDDDQDLVVLCRHLDGLPLAIELAAARAKTLPIPEMTTRLAHRFDLLQSSSRAGSTRHRALGAAIDASYDLLFEDERRVFRTLAVFAGGVTVEAAEAVCGPQALDLLDRLVDRSMLVADTSGRGARFWMLESLREYGIDRLRDAGELDSALDVHTRWCTELATTVDREVHGRDQLPWLERLDAEHDNLRTAVARLATTDPVRGLGLIGALLLPWWTRNRRHEARHWAEVLLAAAVDAPPEVVARVLSFIGMIPESNGWTGGAGELEGELLLALSRQRRAIALSAETGDEVLHAYCQVFLLSTLTRAGAAGIPVDPQEPAHLIEAAGEVLERVGDHYGAGMVLGLAATGHLMRGDVERCTVATGALRVHAVESGERLLACTVAWLDGLQLDMAGDALGAYRHIERSFQHADELGMTTYTAGHAQMLAELAVKLGDPELAARWRSYVPNQNVVRYDGSILATARNQTGLAERAAGRLDHARDAHLEALALYTEVGVMAGAAFSESCLGFLATAAGNDDQAADHHTRSLADATSSGDPASVALALEGSASTLLDRSPRIASQALGAARTLWTRSGRPPTTHRDDVETVERTLRERLGDEAFEAELQHGVATSLLQAVAAVRAQRSPSD